MRQRSLIYTKQTSHFLSIRSSAYSLRSSVPSLAYGSIRSASTYIEFGQAVHAAGTMILIDIPNIFGSIAKDFTASHSQVVL